MTYFNGTLTYVGSGTLQASTGAATAAVSPHANTLPGDLVVVVCYTAADANIVRDAGDGWLVLDSGFDSGTGYGIFLAACLATRAGASGYAGLTLPSSAAYTAQSGVFRLSNPFKFDLATRAPSTGWNNLTASAVALAAPAILQPYEQVIDIIGRGYNNAAATTTVNNVTNFSERFDTGQTSPPHGVVMSQRTLNINGSTQNASVTSNLAVAKTNRAGVRAMVGIIANTYSQRHMVKRRTN